LYFTFAGQFIAPGATASFYGGSVCATCTGGSLQFGGCKREVRNVRKREWKVDHYFDDDVEDYY